MLSIKRLFKSRTMSFLFFFITNVTVPYQNNMHKVKKINLLFLLWGKSISNKYSWKVPGTLEDLFDWPCSWRPQAEIWASNWAVLQTTRAAILISYFSSQWGHSNVTLLTQNQVKSFYRGWNYTQRNPSPVFRDIKQIPHAVDLYL